MDKRVIELVEKHKVDIEYLVSHNCLSSISMEFREDMKECASILGLSGYCFNCNSGLYNVVSRIYTMYVDYKNLENVKSDGENKEKFRRSKRG